MQRQFELICKILAYVEREETNGAVPIPEFDGHTPVEVHNHVRLCVEADYLEAGNPGWYDGHLLYPSITRLTWTGHEALDRLRGENYGPND